MTMMIYHTDELHRPVFDQDVDHESRYFDDIRDIAEDNLAEPGGEFPVDATLVPATSYFNDIRAILVQVDYSTVGTIPEEDIDMWWPIVVAAHDAADNIEVDAQIWTCDDWDERFYASVRIALPDADETREDLSDDFSDENFAAVKGFTNSVEEWTNPKWRQAHGMTDDEYKARATELHRETEAYLAERKKERAAASNPGSPSISSATVTPDQSAAEPDPRLMMVYADKKKTPVAAWLLWLFLGGIGGHRYYLGDIVQGVFMTVTLGGFGFWTLLDAFFIQRRIRVKNAALWKRLSGDFSQQKTS